MDALADNGGPTWTHALLRGSPAIDAGDDETCPTTDQRGVVRPVGPHCDIGAFEGEIDGPNTYLHLPIVGKFVPVVHSTGAGGGIHTDSIFLPAVIR